MSFCLMSLRIMAFGIHCWCRNGITNPSKITLPPLLRNKSQTCTKKQGIQKIFNAQCIQQISGLGTFIDNIESIGQDDCMTEQSFT